MTSLAIEAPGPTALNGLARLMTMAFEGVDLSPIATELIGRACADESDAEALMDLSTVLQLRGLRDLGVTTQGCALARKRLYELPANGRVGLRVLAILMHGDLMTNTPVEFLVANSDVSLSMLYLDPNVPIPDVLPPHDVVFIAISHAERTRPMLAALGESVSRWGQPVINHPTRISETARTRAYEVLEGVEGVSIPPTVRVSRSAFGRWADGEDVLVEILAGATWPLIVRPVDSHAGQGLEKVSSLHEVAAYFHASTASEFFVSPFIDYSDGDGLYRKYRIVLIDGVAYPGHMGVSSDWMIHYLNAGMADSAVKRAEEEEFMRNFRTDFGRRHAWALRSISERFGLDYLVIDCGETAEGDLLVFEVCTGAVVHCMDPVDVFPYKRPHMSEIFTAFRALLGRSAKATPV